MTRFPTPRRSAAPARTGNSTVKGRVVYKDNGQPLKGARVHVFPANNNSDDSDSGPLNGPPGVIAFANNSGEFQVEGLAAGKYFITVEGAGLSLPSGFGMRLPMPMSAIPKREDFEEIIPRHDAQFTVDGNNTAEVEVSIVRGGSISGKVLRPNRAPLAGVAVNIISREGTAGIGIAQFSAETDKNGEYRLENVPPGEYVVAAATEAKGGQFDIRARLRGESRVVTYHPAALSVRDAMAVRVESGRETPGVNVTLVSRSTSSVSGIVVKQQDGTPVADATVVLRNQDSEMGGMIAPGLAQRTTQTDAAGNWSFTNVQEGSYVATALVPTSPLARPMLGPGQVREPRGLGPETRELIRGPRPRFLMAHKDVVLTGAELKGLVLAIVGPGSIRGSVTTENGTPLPAEFMIFLEMVREGTRPERPLPVRLNPDGSFELSDIQGGNVYVNVALPPDAPFFVKSLAANGSDPRLTPLNVIEGAETGPMQIVISSQSASLAGRVVLDKSGEGLSNYIVLLAPVQREKQRFRTSYLTARTASDGSYSLTGEPGEYYVFARKRDDLPPIVTEEFVRLEAPKAKRVSLSSGEPTRLDLRIP